MILPRDPLRREIQSIMQPENPTRFFSIILGRQGSGKSSLVRNVCRALGGGVGYIECSPVSDDFGRDLGEKFEFKLEKHVNFLNLVTQTIVGRKTVEMQNGTGTLPSLRRSADALHAAAIEYRDANNMKPFVLVIDNVDRLQQGSKEALAVLAEYAKDWAQDGSIRCVFVASHLETAMELMGEHPTQGRSADPLIIGELSRSEALELLFALGVGAEHAEKCVEYVGGSLLLLERVAGLLAATGGNLPAAQNKLIKLMTLEIESALLLASSDDGGGGDKTKDVVGALEALGKAPGRKMSGGEWREAVPNGDVRQRLMHSLVHYDGHTVSFSSKLAEECVSGLVSSLSVLSPDSQSK